MLAGSQQTSQQVHDQIRTLTALPVISFDGKSSGDDKSGELKAEHTGPVQINIDQLAPLISESDWDALEDLVHRLSRVGGPASEESDKSGIANLMNKIGEEVTSLGADPHAGEKKRVIVIGMLYTSRILPTPSRATA